jgi:hypothetical protein
LAHLSGTQQKIILEQDTARRDVLIQEYIRAAKELGVTVKYKTNEGQVYE